MSKNINNNERKNYINIPTGLMLCEIQIDELAEVGTFMDISYVTWQIIG